MTKKTVAKREQNRLRHAGEMLLESVETRQQAATQAVRKFADRLDESMPNLVDPSLRKKIIDSATDLVDELFTTQVEFLRSVISSASGTLKQGAAKRAAKGTTKKAAARGTTTRKAAARGTTTRKAAAKGTTKKAAAKGTTRKAAARPRRRQPSP